jgi:hypothetical protein
MTRFREATRAGGGLCPAGAAPQAPYGLASLPRHQVFGELADRVALAAAVLARVAARGGQAGPR